MSLFEQLQLGLDDEIVGEWVESYPGLYRLDGAGDCAMWRIPLSLVTTVRRITESMGKWAEVEEEFQKEVGAEIRQTALLLEQCLQDAGSNDDYTLDRPDDHTFDQLME